MTASQRAADGRTEALEAALIDSARRVAALEAAVREVIDVLTREAGNPRPPTLERVRVGARGKPKARSADKRVLRKLCLRLQRTMEGRTT